MGGGGVNVSGAALESGGKFLGARFLGRGRVAAETGNVLAGERCVMLLFAAAWRRFAARWPEGELRRLSSVWSKGMESFPRSFLMMLR